MKNQPDGIEGNEIAKSVTMFTPELLQALQMMTGIVSYQIEHCGNMDMPDGSPMWNEGDLIKLDNARAVIAKARGCTLAAPDDANHARLIAAAPELLAALEALHAESYLYASEQRPKMTRLCNDARAAIAKAKGEK